MIARIRFGDALILALALALGASSVFAQSFKNEPGKPFTLIFADGREAVLKVAKVDSTPLKTSFQIVDNSCSEHQNMMCNYHFSLRQFTGAFVWSKNPESGRIGQIVEWRPKTPNSPDFKKLAIDEVLLSGLSRWRVPILAAGLSGDALECDDFSWLPGGQIDAPDFVSVTRWDSEMTVRNPESGLGENRTVMGAMGTELTKASPRVLNISKVGIFTDENDLLTADISLMLFPSISMTIAKHDGDTCQVGILSNLFAEIGPIANDLMSRLPRLEDQPDYIVGADEYLQTPLAKTEIPKMLRNAGEFR